MTRRSRLHHVDDPPPLFCAFCKRAEHEVKDMVLGPGALATICDLCVAEAAGIIAKRRRRRFSIVEEPSSA